MQRHSEKNIEVHLSALKDICTDMEIYNDRQLLMKMPIKAKILTPEYFNIPLPFDIPDWSSDVCSSDLLIFRKESSEL